MNVGIVVWIFNFKELDIKGINYWIKFILKDDFGDVL